MIDFVAALTGSLQSPGSENAAPLKAAVTANIDLASEDEAVAGSGVNPTNPTRVAQQIEALKLNVMEVVVESYTPSSTDNNKIRVLTDPAGVGLELPNDISAGFAATYIQGGGGQITFSAEAGGTMRQADGFAHSRTKWSAVTAAVLSNVSGTSAVWILYGDMEE
ncbi:hypothetical protein HFN87_16360 [Rhizobium laguerreae]|uniref:hypothetical protein n=1 Tax=Rhizobium laguerreae TaxID=1076926 RepID=UPI001C90A2CE|nr:hypothetical protein [Rhizobium laguerreae]MBY3414851.1 hypothetical protein [Rhizobium laguerreae]